MEAVGVLVDLDREEQSKSGKFTKSGIYYIVISVTVDEYVRMSL